MTCLRCRFSKNIHRLTTDVGIFPSSLILFFTWFLHYGAHSNKFGRSRNFAFGWINHLYVNFCSLSKGTNCSCQSTLRAAARRLKPVKGCSLIVIWASLCCCASYQGRPSTSRRRLLLADWRAVTWLNRMCGALHAIRTLPKSAILLDRLPEVTFKEREHCSKTK